MDVINKYIIYLGYISGEHTGLHIYIYIYVNIYVCICYVYMYMGVGHKTKVFWAVVGQS